MPGPKTIGSGAEAEVGESAFPMREFLTSLNRSSLALLFKLDDLMHSRRDALLWETRHPRNSL